MSNLKTVNGILLSFLLGGVAGSVIALLYAPSSGKHLRHDISKKANGLIKEGKRKAYDSWNDAKDKAERVIESANDIIDTNVEKIVRNTENLKDALKSGIHAYNDERRS